MAEENKKEDNKEESLGRLDYSIRSMDSDLKKEASKTETFDIQSPPEEQKVPEKKEEELNEELEKPKDVPENPFLSELKTQPQPEGKKASVEKPKEEPKIQKDPPREEEVKEKFSPISKIDSKKSTLGEIEKTDLKKDSAWGADPKNKPATNKGLILILVLTSAMAIGAGFYYFYWMNNSTPPVEPAPVEPEIVPDPEPEPEPEPESLLPEVLANSKNLAITTDSLENMFLAEKEALAENQNNYYQIKNTESEGLSSSDLVSALQIQLPQEVQAGLNENWLFLQSQNDTLKLGLVFEIKDEAVNETTNFLKNNEYRLPELMKNLFIDELFVLDEQSAVFSDSGLASGVRYYNFIEGDNTKSLDWGIIDKKYLFFATSRKTTLNLVEDLKK